MENRLGALIEAEVGRADSDLTALRSRGQAVLTASGALVTVLAAGIAVAAREDSAFDFSTVTRVSAVTGLIAFVVATLFVLTMYFPVGVDAPSDAELAKYAKEAWDEPTWEQDVAVVLSKYLTSLRAAIGRVVFLLRLAIAAEVVGIASMAVMAFSLLGQVD